MLFLIHAEAVKARNDDLRRAADQHRRNRAPSTAHQAPAPEPPRRRARRYIRASAATMAARVAR
jgi:hypothetical protein